MSRDRWLDLDGLWVHVENWAPAAAPPSGLPVLLVHGLGGSTVNWWPVGQDLADALGAPVTALDLAGFGRTRRGRRPATLATNGRLLTATLRERGPAVVVGNSMGAALGVGLAARHPELVPSLVLVDPALPRPPRSLAALGRTVRFAAMNAPLLAAPALGARGRLLGPAGVVDATLRAVVTDPSRVDPAVRDALVGLAADRAVSGEADGSYVQAAGSLFRYLVLGMRRDLGRLHEPTLLLHGSRDRLVPVSFARAAAERHPALELHVLRGSGHTPQLERPGEVVELIAGWLARRHPGGRRPRAGARDGSALRPGV